MNIVDIIDITDITTGIADIITDIADIVTDIAGIADLVLRTLRWKQVGVYKVSWGCPVTIKEELIIHQPTAHIYYNTVILVHID